MRAPDSFSTSFSTEELLGNLEFPGEECFGLSDSLYHMTSSLAGDCDLTVPLQSTPVLTMILVTRKACPLPNQFTERVLTSFCPVLQEVGAALTALLSHRLADYCFISAWKNPKWKLTILKLLGTWRSILAKSHFIGWMPSRKRLIFLPGLKLPT